MCPTGSSNLVHVKTSVEFDEHVKKIHRPADAEKKTAAKRVKEEKFYCHVVGCKKKDGFSRTTLIKHLYTHEMGHFCVDCNCVVQSGGWDYRRNHTNHSIRHLWEFDSLFLSKFEVR